MECTTVYLVDSASAETTSLLSYPHMPTRQRIVTEYSNERLVNQFTSRELKDFSDLSTRSTRPILCIGLSFLYFLAYLDVYTSFFD